MAGITVETAQQNLDAWVAASLAVARNQSYEIEGRTLNRVNAEHIDRMINYWAGWVNKLSRSRSRTRYIVPG